MNFRQLRAWFLRVGGAFDRKRQERELDAELRSHVEMHVDDGVRSGLAPEEARRRAFASLGGLETAKEGVRRERALPLVETFGKDLRYSARRLRRSPGFVVVAVLSLALGIGANTAIFSMVNTAVLRPLPIERPGEVMALTNASSRQMFASFSYPNYRDFRDRNGVLSGLIAYRFAPLSLSHDGVNERLWGYLVSGNYFEVLGVAPAAGRVLTPDDDLQPGAHPVAVVSYDCWQNRFGGDPGVVGKTLVVNGRAYTVVGVAARGFFGTEIIAAPEVWFPMAMEPQIEVGSTSLENRYAENVFVQGRLAPGVTVARAETELNAIAADLEREFPDANEGKRVALTSPGYMGGSGVRGVLLGFTGVLMVVVAFVLLLACTNLANLLLARSTERRREISVRLALGASRARVVWQLLVESLILSTASGAVGLVLAFWLIRLAVAYKPPIDVPLFVDLHVDARVFAFTCGISLVTGVLFGLLPAIQATKVDLLSALKDESQFASPRRSWWKSGLIAFQVALSLVLLVGGGLMVRALQRAETLDLGFDPNGAVEVSFDLRLQGYERARGLEFQRTLLDRVRARDGVQGAGLVDVVPVDLHFSRTSVFVDGQMEERGGNAPRSMASRVSPGYFRAMSTRLVRGRDFTEQDDASSALVAVVNETFARRFWPDGDAIGRQFRHGGPDAPLVEIVGIVEDGKYAGLNESPQLYFCRPIAQWYSGMNSLVVRTIGDQATLIAALRDDVRQLDPAMPLATAQPLVRRMAMPLLPARLAASVLGGFGLLALTLAAIGIYGVMSNSVARRTREIGVRLALGAQAADVRRLVVGQGMAMVLVGVVTGLAAALAIMRMTESLLFGVSAADPLTYTAVAALLVGVAALAAYIPARRATRIDPVVALRSE